MAGTNQFLALATGGGANVLAPAAYAALTSLISSGFQSGVAPSAQVNTALRQATFVAAAVAQLIADATGLNANDDGVILNFEKQLALAVDLARYAVDTGAANVYQVAYTPAVIAAVDGMVLRFKAKTANTGASTFSPNGLTAQPIVGGDHAALSGGEIIINSDVWVQWNSTLAAWVLVDSTGGFLKGPTPATGDRSNKMATTQMFANEFAASLIGTGYTKLPNGLILQWGTLANSATPGTGTAVTFPIAFPSLIMQVLVSNANGYSTGVVSSNSTTLTGFNSFSSVGSSVSSWLAIGK